MTDTDKSYKVLLVEDIFFKDQPDSAEVIGGLEKELAGRTKHKIDLEITPRVDEALEKIDKGKYDLVVTDLGLVYPRDERTEQIKSSEVYSKLKDGIMTGLDKKFKELQEKYDLKKFYGSKEEREMTRDDMQSFLREEKCPVSKIDKIALRELGVLPESAWRGDFAKEGLGIAEKARKKTKTVIFTDSESHGSLMPIILYLSGLCSEEHVDQALHDSYSDQLRSSKQKIDDVYYYPKWGLDYFVHVIDDALDSLAEGQEQK